MLGDTAVAVHPDDERYRHLIGRRAAPAARGSRHTHHRRRLCRPGVRQRLRQDHARARLQRLRSRTAARLAHDQHHDAGSRAQRQRSRGLSRTRPLRCAHAHSRRSRGAGPHRPDRTAQAHGAARRSQQCGVGAAVDRSMVRRHQAAGRAGDSRRRRRTHPLRSGELVRRVLRMDAKHQGLVHQPATVVGSPHTGVVRQRRPLVRCAQRSGGARRAWARSLRGVAAGRGRVGHLVFLGAVALLHAGLAAADAARCALIIRLPSWSRASTSYSSGSPA